MSQESATPLPQEVGVDGRVTATTLESRMEDLPGPLMTTHACGPGGYLESLCAGGATFCKGVRCLFGELVLGGRLVATACATTSPASSLKGCGGTQTTKSK